MRKIQVSSSLWILFFGLNLFSCGDTSKDTATNSEYKMYLFEQQGWKSKSMEQNINDISYKATEVPLQYYILKNLGSDQTKVDSTYKSHAMERIIEVEFQHTAEKDLLNSEFTRRSYEDAVKHMAFKIEKDFKIVTSSNDTILCSGVNFERNFKVAPFKRILLHFGNIPQDDTIQLIYQDQLFGNGIIKFSFGQTPLKL